MHFSIDSNLHFPNSILTQFRETLSISRHLFETLCLCQLCKACTFWSFCFLRASLEPGKPRMLPLDCRATHVGFKSAPQHQSHRSTRSMQHWLISCDTRKLQYDSTRNDQKQAAIDHWKRPCARTAQLIWLMSLFANKALWAVLHVRGMTSSKADFGHASCSNLALQNTLNRA